MLNNIVPSTIKGMVSHPQSSSAAFLYTGIPRHNLIQKFWIITPVGSRHELQNVFKIFVYIKTVCFSRLNKTVYNSGCSLIETAKANGLNVYAYLQHLLLYMPGSEWQTYPEELDALMPWASEVQKNCK